jgi:hypothetical protein
MARCVAALDKAAEPFTSVIGLNDNHGTTFDDVLQAFERAIRNEQTSP